MRKKDKEQLLKNIHYLCVDKYDGIWTDELGRISYMVPTKYGRLIITPQISMERDNKWTTFFIALKFEDTDILKQEAPLEMIMSGHEAHLHGAHINQYSGKWNITLGRFTTRQDLYDELDRRLGAVASRQRIL